MKKSIDDGKIKSCSEVFREVAVKDDAVAKWAKNNKDIFEKPTESELNNVRNLFSQFPNYENTLIKKKTIEAGTPAADVFVIAKDQTIGATVVSQERFKNHGGKIPNVCKNLDIKHFSLFEFFRHEGWKF